MIDTHCHILKEYYDNIDEVINNMKDNIIIVAGTNQKTNEEVIELCKKYPFVYGTIGIHPEAVLNFKDEDLEYIERNINNKKIVGIGEIGLDYYWTKDNIDLQKELFIKQLVLAKKYNKTVVVHSRDSIEDTYNILKEYAGNIKKVIHCFSSSYEMAQKFINIGCMLGIGGVITFKNSVKMVEVVKNIDIKNLLLETDSPFLTPEPYRGKVNEPKNVLFVAQKIAEIKDLDLEKVLKVTTDNAIFQFDLDRVI